MDVIGRVLDTGEMVLREVGRGALAHVYLVSDGTAVRALKLLPEGRVDRADHEFRVAHGLDRWVRAQGASQISELIGAVRLPESAR